MRVLKPVAPDELGAVWPRLRVPLATMESPDGWLPEDVYLTLKTGGATLYLVIVDDKEVGFLVLRNIRDFDGPRLHIWLLHASSDVDVMAEFSAEMDNIARSINATTVTFGTTRRGWAKVAPRYQFSVRETLYSRKVNR